MAQDYFLGYDAAFLGKYTTLKFQGHVLPPSSKWHNEEKYLEEGKSSFLQNAAAYPTKQKALHSRRSNLVEE
jgi:hypothetical protein